MIGSDTYSYGGGPLAFNAAGNSLFVGASSGRLAEITIPGAVNTSNINALPFASIRQGFSDPTEGNFSGVSQSNVKLGGLLVYGDRLYGSAYIFYDANNEQRVSHFSRSVRLNEPSFRGWSQVWEPARSGFVSGFMSLIPAEWQAQLGGNAITGQCCIPIIYRTSLGPSALSMDLTQIGQGTVGASPLLYYPDNHATLGPWASSNPVYGATTIITGAAVIAGTRTVLYFGSNGTGEFCYGTGTADRSLAGTRDPDNELYCYDPTSPDKGQHAYPYNYQIWAYDLNELLAVKNGAKQPWEVRPYGVWPFGFPTDSHQMRFRIGGVAYDSSTQSLYVSQMFADQDVYENRALIHVLKIGAAGSPLPSPSPATTVPAPSSPVVPGGKVSAVSLTANKPSPQSVGTNITFTATANGGTAPLEYKWWIYDGAAWIANGSWTGSSTFNWTPSQPNSAYRVGVWVRSHGSTADQQEASVETPYVISSGASSGGAVQSVSITPGKTSPQPPGTSIRFTATPSGGSAPLQYKWWIYDGSWAEVTAWTASATFDWSPARENPSYQVGVWVRSSGSASDQEASAAIPFAILGAAEVSPPPASSPSPIPPISSLNVTANKPSPQPAGSTIGWTAAVAGGRAPYQFKWAVFDGATMLSTTSWQSSNTFAWTPTAASGHYVIAAWVRSDGNTTGEAEATRAMIFEITAPATSITEPPPSTTPTSPTPTSPTPITPPPTTTPAPETPTAPAARVSSVTVTSDLAAPQPLGKTVRWTATPVGGVAPHQYQWAVFNGGTLVSRSSWSTSNQFAWTPGTASLQYSVMVSVRSAGNTLDAAEASTMKIFPITP